MDYNEIIETLKDLCENGMGIPEQSFINTFDMLNKQKDIYITAPFYKKYILAQRRIVYITIGDESMYITAMTVEMYNKETSESNSIVFAKTDDEIKIIGISDKARNGKLIYANKEEAVKYKITGGGI